MPDCTADTIDRVWQAFRSSVIPAAATTDQLEFARLTFFAGALSMYDMLIDATELLDDDDAETVLRAIGEELNAFDAAMKTKTEGRRA
jgi:hypothetical protein